MDSRNEILREQTPELSMEFRRTLTIWMIVVFSGIALFSIIFALAVDPSLSDVTGGVAMAMFGLCLGLIIPTAGLMLTLVTLFDCWPVMLRKKFLTSRFGVPPEQLTGQAFRTEMKERGYWKAVAQGAIVGWAFVSVALLVWWGLTGKLSFGAPSLVVVLLAGQVAGQSWIVRRIVERHLAQSTIVADPMPGA